MGRISNSIFKSLRNVVNRITQNIFRGITGKRMSLTETGGQGRELKKLSDDVEKEIKKQEKGDKRKYSAERKKLAAEVQKMAAQANRRLERLERNGLQTVSAYMRWQENGGVRFSVKGKSYQELQREYWRVKNFLDAKTSTVRGAKENMKKIATEIMRLKGSNVEGMSTRQLVSLTSNFFKIKEQIEKNYEQVNDNAKRLDYQRIMNEITNYFQSDAQELEGLGDMDIKGYADMIQGLIDRENTDITDAYIDWK